MRPLLVVLLSAASLPGQVLLSDSEFSTGKPAGWTRFSPRDEIAPRTYVDARHSRGAGGSLAVSGAKNPAVSGGWTRTVNGIKPTQWYRLTAWYRAEGLTQEENQILCLLGWQDASGRKAGQPEFAWETATENGWRRITVAAPAPETAASAVVKLSLQNAPAATVWWDDIRLERVPAPEPRKVTIAAVRFRPRRSSGPAENLKTFREVIEKQAPAGTDLVVLPEGMTVVGTGKSYSDVAEPLPGPTTQALGELARIRKSWIVAGLYEREGAAVYNTAVLIDREGRLAGKYRKVYLPREEVEAGLTPGSEYPVFQTDFGKLGMMICWDVHYTDPARALALQGAEIVALPIWGGNLDLTKARAIENGVFLATSGYDIPSLVFNPMGETLAASETDATVAVATVDLNRRYEWPWLGNMKGRFHREVRLDVPVRRGK
jgi:predicted amidohydrolase